MSRHSLQASLSQISSVPYLQGTVTTTTDQFVTVYDQGPYSTLVTTERVGGGIRARERERETEREIRIREGREGIGVREGVREEI